MRRPAALSSFARNPSRQVRTNVRKRALAGRSGPGTRARTRGRRIPASGPARPPGCAATAAGRRRRPGASSSAPAPRTPPPRARRIDAAQIADDRWTRCRKCAPVAPGSWWNAIVWLAGAVHAIGVGVCVNSFRRVSVTLTVTLVFASSLALGARPPARHPRRRLLPPGPAARAWASRSTAATPRPRTSTRRSRRRTIPKTVSVWKFKGLYLRGDQQRRARRGPPPSRWALRAQAVDERVVCVRTAPVPPGRVQADRLHGRARRRRRLQGRRDAATTFNVDSGLGFKMEKNPGFDRRDRLRHHRVGQVRAQALADRRDHAEPWGAVEGERVRGCALHVYDRRRRRPDDADADEDRACSTRIRRVRPTPPSRTTTSRCSLHWSTSSKIGDGGRRSGIGEVRTGYIGNRADRIHG